MDINRLDPNITDKALIEEKINEAYKQWKDRADKTSKAEHKKLVDLIPDIRDVMLNPEKRKAEAKAALMSIALDPAKLDEARNLLPETYPKLEETLIHQKYTDIYDFFSRDPASGNRTGRFGFSDAFESLVAHAKFLMEQYRNLADSTEKMQLASLTADFFSNGHREAYNAYIILATKATLCTEVDKVVEVMSELNKEKSSKLTSDFTRLFFSQKEVASFIKEYCEYKGYKTATAGGQKSSSTDPIIESPIQTTGSESETKSPFDKYQQGSFIDDTDNTGGTSGDGKPMYTPKPQRNTNAGLMGIFLGTLGVHNFYIGRKVRGFVQLALTALTFISLGKLPLFWIPLIWGFIEGIRLYNRKTEVSRKEEDPQFDKLWVKAKEHKKVTAPVAGGVVLCSFAIPFIMMLAANSEDVVPAGSNLSLNTPSTIVTDTTNAPAPTTSTPTTTEIPPTTEESTEPPTTEMPTTETPIEIQQEETDIITISDALEPEPTTTKPPPVPPPPKYPEEVALSVNTATTGKLETNSTINWYSVTLPSDGKINLKIDHANTEQHRHAWQIQMFDIDENEVVNFSSNGIQTSVTSRNLFLVAGTYYIRVRNADWHSDIDYRLTVSFEANTGQYEIEPNNTRETATTLLVNSEITANLHYGSDVDFFKVTLPNNGKVALTIRHSNTEQHRHAWQIQMFDIDENEVVNFSSNGIQTNVTSRNLFLAAGTYYIRVRNADWHSDIDYRLTVSFEANTGQYEIEPNNNINNASPINAKEEVITGNLHYDWDIDYYKFNVSTAGNFTVNFAHGNTEQHRHAWLIRIIDASENEIFRFASNGTQTNITSDNHSLSSGIYYVIVQRNDWYSDIDYRLTINSTNGQLRPF